MHYKYLIFCLIFIFTPIVATADVKTPQGRIIECFCTDTNGQRHELGDIICLTVDNRSFLAKCVMAQNNPFWREQQQGCNSSSLPTDFFMPKIIPANFSVNQ